MCSRDLALMENASGENEETPSLLRPFFSLPLYWCHRQSERHILSHCLWFLVFCISYSSSFSPLIVLYPQCFVRFAFFLSGYEEACCWQSALPLPLWNKTSTMQHNSKQKRLKLRRWSQKEEVKRKDRERQINLQLQEEKRDKTIRPEGRASQLVGALSRFQASSYSPSWEEKS